MRKKLSFLALAVAFSAAIASATHINPNDWDKLAAADITIEVSESVITAHGSTYVEFVQKIARSFLGGKKIYLLYRTEEVIARDGAETESGTIAITQIRYNKALLDLVSDELFDQVKDFIVTDGHLIIRVKFSGPAVAGSEER